ncbi:MAG: D-glycerate dehydrogenase [Anaerolineales bacterium]|nr:D-glycerate dehydrogenase [Anaerolineales bacterium]MDW8446683.1 D-glycerate dehydrogenase [Anaerolineales bacterium]
MAAENLPLVILTHSLPAEWLTKLEGKCRTVVGPWDATHFDASLEPYLAEAEGLFCLLTIKVDEELLKRAPKLRVVSNMAVGYDNIDVAACTARRIPVGNTPGVLTAATADLTMALLLAAARQIPQASKDAREGRWITWSPAGWLGADLEGATLGIVGMGKIGRAVAQRAKGFGMKLLYTDIPLPPEIESELGAKRVELPELLRESDFVTLHVPLTPETRGMIGEEQLRMMKPHAILVNTARGPVVQTAALLKALQQNWIGGAALDVTDPEPLPPDHPLYAQPNCLIVPHIGSATRNTRRRMAELACENLLAGLEGRHLPNCVNPEVYAEA